MSLDPARRQLAMQVVKGLGIDPATKPPLSRFDNFKRTAHVHVITVEDCPQPAVTTYATAGVSDSASNWELVTAAASKQPDLADALASAAWEILVHGADVRAGTILHHVWSGAVFPRFRHALLTTPEPWPGLQRGFRQGHHDIDWLWLIPITDAEADMAGRQDADNFRQGLLGTAVWDLDREELRG